MIHKLNLISFPKIKLLNFQTPIYHLTTLSKLLDVDIYIKRDDLTEFGFGGNKLRKLEYLLGEALKNNATHVLTLGAIQSNHARLTAITANQHGFIPELFLKDSVNNQSSNYLQNGNLLLERIIDCKQHFIKNDDSVMQHVNERILQIKKEGGRPYFIPVGGSNALGTLGYLDCFYEIINFESTQNIHFSHLITATGSGGTHAGLLIGNKISNRNINIYGYNVQPEEQELKQHTLQITNEMLNLLEKPPIHMQDINLITKYAGREYGIPESIHIDMLKLLAKTEGIFLDPVYTAKAFSGLVMGIEEGLYKKGDKLLYLHTGGAPSIFAYENFF